LGRHCLLGDLLLVDASTLLAPGNDAERIARRDQADRETFEGRARSHSPGPSKCRRDQGIGERCVEQGLGAQAMIRRDVLPHVRLLFLAGEEKWDVRKHVPPSIE